MFAEVFYFQDRSRGIKDQVKTPSNNQYYQFTN